jgi:tetratricopeptide (TPR) repeat protein
MAAMHKGDYGASDKYYRQVVDELRPTSGDYNNIAWNALLSGKDLDNALEDARQAMQRGGGSALLHTLASLYAETGKSLEAREALLKSMDDAGRDEPAPHDWYVLGRIAENYGATDAAVAAYRKVDKPKESVLSSTWVLADRRLKAIGKR